MNQTCRSIFGDSHEITAITIPLSCLLIQIMTFLYLYFVLMLFSFNINMFLLDSILLPVENIMGLFRLGKYQGFPPGPPGRGISWVYSRYRISWVYSS